MLFNNHTRKDLGRRCGDGGVAEQGALSDTGLLLSPVLEEGPPPPPPQPKEADAVDHPQPRHHRGGCHRVPSRSPSFLPRPFVQGGSRSLLDTMKDPIEGILLADAIAEAAKSNEPLMGDKGSEFGGDHSDFLLSMPFSDHRREAYLGRGTSSPAPSSNAHQPETATRKRLSFRPRTTVAAGIHAPSLNGRQSLDNGPGREAVGGSAPSSAVAALEGPNERAFSDAACPSNLW